MIETWQESIDNEAVLLFKDARLSGETLAVLEECWEYHQAENKIKSSQYAQWFYLALAAAALFTDDLKPGIPTALAMELLALAADILDDLADQNNDAAPWRMMAPALALHTGACFLALSFQALSTIDDPGKFKKLASLFSTTGSRAYDGQIQEICQQQVGITQEECLQITGDKAASLISCACEAVAIAGCARDEDRALMGQFGRNVGIIAQIHNDLRDLLDTTGKSDFRKKGQSLPVIYLQNALQEELDWDQDRLRRMLKEKGAIAYCDFICEVYASEALKALDRVNVPMEKKKGLMSIVTP
jgi:competence protein ComQ